MKRVPTADFFKRDSHTVAKELLGMYLVHEHQGMKHRARITEVEVYDGFEDKASHARAGVTPRTAVMYGKGGVWYVYLCYGIHFMLNIVTREEGYPAAILIRSVETAVGPGVVTRTFGIDKTYNGLRAVKKNGLWIEDSGDTHPKKIKTSPRVGVSYAGKRWASRKWRYTLCE